MNYNNNRGGELLYGLDFLRVLFAVILLLGHIPLYYLNIPASHNVHLPAGSVYCFFSISGFLAGYRKDKILSLSDYYKKKAVRLLPSYYLWLLIVLIVISSMGQFHFFEEGRILYYILLLPNIAFVLPKAIIDPYSNLWFIGSITMFYLVFPFVARNKGKKFFFVSSGIAIIWMAMKLIIGFCFLRGPFYRFLASTSFDCLFIGAIAGALFYEYGNIFSGYLKSKTLIVFVWLLYIGSGYYINYLPSIIANEYISIISIFIIISLQRNFKTNLLQNSFWAFCGKVSFEFYIVQNLVMRVINFCILHFDWTVTTSLLYFILLQLSL